MSNLKHTYAGEMQFTRYSDTSRSGQMVTFTLPGREELEAFIGEEGSRFQAVFVKIGADEQPEPIEQPKPERRPGGPLSRLAGIWCRDPRFLQWAKRDSDEAAQWMREICGVSSRAELDSNPLAASKFQSFIREPFMDWLVMEQHL